MFRSLCGFAPALISTLVLLGLRPALSQTGELSTQRAALNQVGQAVSRVVVKARGVNQKLSYGFSEGGCLFGVKLRPGGAASENFSLRAGESYVFIGGGDQTARNVDLTLRDASGRVVSQDIEADAAPFVLFQPKISGRYTLSLSLKAGWRGPAFCAFTVLRKGGLKLPLEHLVEAAIRLDYASFDTFRSAGGGRFNEASGTWALYGAVLRQGQALSSAPKRFVAGKRGVVAVGDRGVRDLDLTLLDGRGKVLAQDTQHGGAPTIARKVGAGTLSVRVSNRSSVGPALVMAALLDLPSRKISVPSPAPTPSLAPTPAPSPLSPFESPQTSPFVGDWTGDFADAFQARTGSFKMRVKPDGSLSGHLSLPSLKVAVRFKGVVTPSGALRLNYTQARQDSVVEGTLTFTNDARQEAHGRAAFSTQGAIFGVAEFALTKRD